MDEKTVADIPDSVLLERAIGTIMYHRKSNRPAWAEIKDVFGLGSTFSAQLCKRFGYDPYTGEKTEE